jgi:SAM-dependent methyltransferase
MRASAPAALRNRAPILAALRELLPATARVLEIGSGTGEHAAFFCDAVPTWTWQPTDASSPALASIEAHRRTVRSSGLRPALALDARTTDWPPGPFDAVFSANVIHISPWRVCLGLLDGASRVLAPAGLLVLYGPFRFDGVFLADSNAAFDARLRAEDPEWGVRDVSDLTREARARGFAEPERFALPANNHVLVFGR